MWLNLWPLWHGKFVDIEGAPRWHASCGILNMALHANDALCAVRLFCHRRLHFL
jgi:hypothetical protein